MHLYWILTKLRSSSGSAASFAYNFRFSSLFFFFFSFAIVQSEPKSHWARLNYQWKCNSRWWYETCYAIHEHLQLGTAYAADVWWRTKWIPWMDRCSMQRWWSVGNVIIFVLPELFMQFIIICDVHERRTYRLLNTKIECKRSWLGRCKTNHDELITAYGMYVRREHWVVRKIIYNELKSPFARAHSDAPFIIIIFAKLVDEMAEFKKPQKNWRVGSIAATHIKIVRSKSHLRSLASVLRSFCRFRRARHWTRCALVRQL